MAWAWQRNYVTLRSGERVRYAFYQKDQSDVYFVRFRAKEGGYARLSTGQAKKPQAIDEAHRLILENYEQVAPAAERMSWELAKAKLMVAMEADGKRPRTVGGYVETLDKLIAMFPLARGPADVTDRMAGDFKTKYATGKFSRKRKTEDPSAMQARRIKSLDSRLRTLKAAFGWLKELRLVDQNPFENVAQPEMDRHEVKYVREGDVSAFFDWLEGRYPGWRMPHLFFSVKAATACRLEDLCGLRSSQLQDGRLVFTADTHQEPRRALRDPARGPVRRAGRLPGRRLPVGALPAGAQGGEQEARRAHPPAERGVLPAAALPLGRGADAGLPESHGGRPVEPRLPPGGVHPGGRGGRPPQAGGRGLRRDARDDAQVLHRHREEADRRRGAGRAPGQAAAEEERSGGLTARVNSGVNSGFPMSILAPAPAGAFSFPGGVPTAGFLKLTRNWHISRIGTAWERQEPPQLFAVTALR